MILLSKLSKKIINNRISPNIFIHPFSGLKIITKFNQNKYFKTDMEKVEAPKEQEQIQTLLTELNIKETNLPDVQKKETRYQRYNFF